MDINNLEQRIRNFDFNFLNYISSETKHLSNKVIFFSCITLFLNFKILTLKELELEGISIEIKNEIINVILFFINLYFFLQFRNSIRIDVLMLKIPEEHKNISKTISNFYAEQTRKMENLSEQYRKALHDEDYSVETSDRLSAIQNKIEEEIPDSFDTWIENSQKSMRYKNYNLALNQYFPSLCFITSFISQFCYLLNLFNQK
jgi:hypothetical protein